MLSREHLTWEQRREALDIDFGGDTPKLHEIRFLERFTVELGNEVEWISPPAPHDRFGRPPSNDFRWCNEDGIEVELKHRDPAAVARAKVDDYIAFRRSFGQSARKAISHPRHPLVKEYFIADMEQRELNDELRAELAHINQDIIALELNYPFVRRLWVMHRAGLEEIRLV